MNTSKIVGEYTADGRIDYRELRHRYVNTICGIPDPKSPDGSGLLPKYIYQIDKGRIYTYDMGHEQEAQYTSPLDNRVMIDIPQLGMISHGGSVIYIEMRNNRIWRRGLTLDLIKVIDPLQDDSHIVNQSFSLRTHSSANKIMHSVYNNKYVTFNEGVQTLMDNKMRAVPLNSSFFLAISSASEEILVGYKKWVVGHVVMELDKSYSIILDKEGKHLKEELSKYANVK